MSPASSADKLVYIGRNSGVLDQLITNKNAINDPVINVMRTANFALEKCLKNVFSCAGNSDIENAIETLNYSGIRFNSSYAVISLF